MGSTQEAALCNGVEKINLEEIIPKMVDNFFQTTDKKSSDTCRDKIIKFMSLDPSTVPLVVDKVTHYSVTKSGYAVKMKDFLLRSYTFLQNELKASMYMNVQNNINKIVSSQEMRICLENLFQGNTYQNICYTELLQIMTDHISDEIQKLVPDSVYYRQCYCDILYFILLFFDVHAKSIASNNQPNREWIYTFQILCDFLDRRLGSMKNLFANLDGRPLPDDWSHFESLTKSRDEPDLSNLKPVQYSSENMADQINKILSWLRHFLTSDAKMYTSSSLRSSALNTLLSATFSLSGQLSSKNIELIPCNSSEYESEINSFGDDPDVMMEFEKFLESSGQS